VTNSTQLESNLPKEDIIFTVPSKDKTAMMASSQEDGSHLNVGPQVNNASVLVSLQENMTSMIACPQENVVFTPIKETATVAKLPESSKEKKPLKQSEKKSNGDLNVNEINQKVCRGSIHVKYNFSLYSVTSIEPIEQFNFALIQFCTVLSYCYSVYCKCNFILRVLFLAHLASRS
jgi:hypothetical protein